MYHYTSKVFELYYEHGYHVWKSQASPDDPTEVELNQYLQKMGTQGWVIQGFWQCDRELLHMDEVDTHQDHFFKHPIITILMVHAPQPQAVVSGPSPFQS